MRYPNLSHEKKLWQNGFSAVAGLDEVGKGAWAGPLVCSAVILSPQKKISGLKDSKLLSAKKREQLFSVISDSALAWSIGLTTESEIDQMGITEANLTAFERAIFGLAVKADYLLIDAVKFDRPGLPYQAIIDGDYLVASIAAASIMAKVTRDRMMVDYHDKYPQYGFDAHKGYGTFRHQENLLKWGSCPLHRQSFSPIHNLSKKQISVY